MRSTLLFSHDQHFELAIFRGREEKPARPGIERQGLGSRQSFHGFDLSVLIGAIAIGCGEFRATAKFDRADNIA